MDRLKGLIDGLNVEIYNPVGLHIKWSRDAAFLFVSAHTIHVMLSIDLTAFFVSLK